MRISSQPNLRSIKDQRDAAVSPLENALARLRAEQADIQKVLQQHPADHELAAFAQDALRRIGEVQARIKAIDKTCALGIAKIHQVEAMMTALERKLADARAKKGHSGGGE